jgi:hypothetical protein
MTGVYEDGKIEDENEDEDEEEWKRGRPAGLAASALYNMI